MELGNQTVGDLLAHYREAKGVSAETLAGALGMSKATYNRLLNDETVIKVPAFLTILDMLRLTFNEVEPMLETSWLPLVSTYDHVSAVIGHATQAFMLDHKVESEPVHELIAELGTKYQETRNEGYAQFQLMAQLFLAELEQDLPQAERVSEQLYQTLIGLDTWGSFEFRLLAGITAYLPFERLQVIFSRHLYQANDDPVSFTNLDDHQLDLLYNAFLGNAIHSQQAANIHLAQKWIRQRVVPDKALGFRSLKRFCDIVDLYLADRLAEAEALYQQLYNMMLLLTASERNIWCMVIKDMWGDLAYFKVNELEAKHE